MNIHIRRAQGRPEKTEHCTERRKNTQPLLIGRSSPAPSSSPATSSHSYHPHPAYPPHHHHYQNTGKTPRIIPCFPAPTVPLGLGLERLHLRGHLFIHLLPHSARILDLALETSILHILRAFSSPTTDHLFFAENSNPCARQARQQPIHRPVAASVPCAVTAMSPMRWER